jgi:Family of unknown function (DUF5781)
LSSEKEKVERAKNAALKMMTDAGFAISDRLQVLVDRELSFMGYSTRRDGKDTIVVAGRALNSGMIEGLLVHEMSHVYRTRTHHPSHNHELLNKVERYILGRDDLKADYQVAVIQEAVNHVQDLYADDVAFQVFSRNETFQNGRVFDFFLTWINDKPIEEKTPKTVWLNVGIMLNNCFVLSNMARHGLSDVDDRAANKVQKFLSQTNDRVNREFLHFKDYMVELKDNPSEDEFEKGLVDYLERVIGLAKDLVRLL